MGKRQTHCKHGHPLSDDNLYISPKGTRGCRKCRNAHAKKHTTPEQMRVARARWREKNPEYHKNHWLMRKYGLTREEHDRMLSEQGNRCAICERLMSKPCVDHNHVTDEVRELLCDQCNFAVGMVREDVLISEKLTGYLRKWGC